MTQFISVPAKMFPDSIDVVFQPGTYVDFVLEYWWLLWEQQSVKCAIRFLHILLSDLIGSSLHQSAWVILYLGSTLHQMPCPVHSASMLIPCETLFVFMVFFFGTFCSYLASDNIMHVSIVTIASAVYIHIHSHVIFLFCLLTKLCLEVSERGFSHKDECHIL